MQSMHLSTTTEDNGSSGMIQDAKIINEKMQERDPI